MEEAGSVERCCKVVLCHRFSAFRLQRSLFQYDRFSQQHNFHRSLLTFQHNGKAKCLENSIKVPCPHEKLSYFVITGSLSNASNSMSISPTQAFLFLAKGRFFFFFFFR